MTLRVSTITAPWRPRVRSKPTWLSDMSLRLRTYRSLLDLLPPEKNGSAMVDLGSGPGLFSQVAHRKGFRVTAVDVRPPWSFDGSPLPEGALSGIGFVQADARGFDVSGFDIAGIIGLIYHLTLDEQVALMTRCREMIAIVDTEIYDPAALSEAAATRVRASTRATGYDGIEWQEEDRVWSSSGNPYSFWHTLPSLLRMFENTGFRDVGVVEPAYRSPHGVRQWFLLNAGIGAA